MLNLSENTHKPDTPHDRANQIDSILEQIRPAMEADGGGINLLRVQGDNVYISLKGSCLFCPSISLTFNITVVPTIKAGAIWVNEVIMENPI